MDTESPHSEPPTVGVGVTSIGYRTDCESITRHSCIGDASGMCSPNVRGHMKEAGPANEERDPDLAHEYINHR